MHSRGLKIFGWTVAGIVVVLAVVTAVLLARSRGVVPQTEANPARSYTEALERIDEMSSRDGDDILGPTLFLDQGSRVDTAVVLFHGYTNNPEQFEQIGEAFHEAGYNVLIPRLPEHGQRDLMTTDMSKIDSARLVRSMDEAVDAAAGLGERVEVVGLSGGGTLASLAAMDRDEVASAVIISPLFGVDLLPSFLVRPIVAWSDVAPDRYFWWDPRLKEDHLPPDAYPRYSLKSISAFFEVGFDIMRREPRRTTDLESVVLITNAADQSVDEGVARDVFTTELAPHASESVEFEFPKENDYAHDLIDPNGLNADNIEDIYAALWPYLGIK